MIERVREVRGSSYFFTANGVLPGCGDLVQPSLPTGNDVRRAKRYNTVRLAALALSTAWRVGVLSGFAASGRAARFKRGIRTATGSERAAGPVFLAAASGLVASLDLPIAYLGGHLVDRRFGVTRQSGSAWLAEQIKSLMIGLLVQTPLLTGCFVLMRRRPRDWWLIAAAASVPLATAFSYLAPVLIMPRFNRFDLLDDPGLESQIRQLSEKSGVRISNVYRMDMSRQTEKPNAFFAGIGTTKRIVLSDTLLEQFPEGEITAVVAHELGHQAHGDIWRLTGFASAAGFAVAWLFARFAPGVVRATARFTDVDEMGDEAAFPLLALQMTGFGVILMPILAAYSRSLERGADRFAVALTGDNVVYAQALERLGALGLADPDPHPLVVFLLYSHPPLGERIRSALGERANVAPPAVAGT